MLTEMPKVGDKVRYVGDRIEYLTHGKVYEITGLTNQGECDFAEFVDDEDDVIDLGHADFGEWEPVTESSPTMHDLLANIGRRLSEVEAELAPTATYDDDIEAELDAYEANSEDAVNSPQHYTQGDIEVIDYIDQVADGYPGRQAVYAGNVIKYVSRAPYKNQAQDIRKAIWYAERLADAMEAEQTK